jgi:hypothetical protein
VIVLVQSLAAFVSSRSARAKPINNLRLQLISTYTWAYRLTKMTHSSRHHLDCKLRSYALAPKTAILLPSQIHPRSKTRSKENNKQKEAWKQRCKVSITTKEQLQQWLSHKRGSHRVSAKRRSNKVNQWSYWAKLSTIPWRHMREGRYSSTILEFGTRRRWVVMSQPGCFAIRETATRTHCKRKLDGVQSPSGCYRKEKCVLPLLRVKTPFHPPETELQVLGCSWEVFSSNSH